LESAAVKPPLLFLHGFGGAGADFAHAARETFERDYDILAPDLRSPERKITHRQFAIDMLALLDARGIAKIKAIGLSMGGNTLLHLASRAPERVEAMVIISSTMHFPEPARAIMRQTMHEGQSVADWLLHDPADMSFTAADLSKITARTLIIYGDRDPLYPVDMGVAIYRAIPNAALWVMPNAGHGDIFGDNKAAFVATTQRFLRA
jgi:pimeloyl-ACP methyl ester carboxylesterase